MQLSREGDFSWISSDSYSPVRTCIERRSLKDEERGLLIFRLAKSFVMNTT
jgi:hypothetical protein